MKKKIHTFCVLSLLRLLTGAASGQDSGFPADSGFTGIAYGEQPAWKITGAIATVSGEELRKTPAATLSNTLYGRIPGLTIMQGSGEPGYDAPVLYARGLSSYRDGNILLFVDGFETPFDQLVPDEVETISLLKDATALALYGIRGANGVLLVTTKRGTRGAPRIHFSAQTGWQSPMRLPQPLGSYDYARLYNEALINEGKPARYTQADLEAYRSGSDPYFRSDVNWYEEVLKNTAPIMNYDLNFRGGGESVRYFVLLNVLQNEGLYKHTDPKREENSNAHFLRYNFRSNVDIGITERLGASLYLGGRIEDRTSPAGMMAGELFEQLSLTPPNAFPVYTPDNRYGGSPVYTNPVGIVLSSGLYNNHNRNFQAVFRLSYKLDMITEGLSADGAVAFSNFFAGTSTKSRTFATYALSRDDTGDTVYNQIGQDSPLSGSEDFREQWRRANAQFRLHYDHTAGASRWNALAMYLQDQYVISGDNVPFAYRNIAGRATYSFREKYIAEFAASYSGTDNFLAGNRFGFFPAISAGWIASQEPFLEKSNWLDFLKLRVSYGMVGNDQIGGQRFTYEQYYNWQGGYHFGNNNSFFSGVDEGSLSNPGVTWEKKTIADLGIEATVLGCVNIGLDVFQENRDRILAEPHGTIPGFLGVALPVLNEGKVRNRGFETHVTYRSRRTGNFQYYVEGSAWFARNNILFIPEPLQPYDYLYRTGRPVGQLFGLEADGFYQESDFQAAGQLNAGLPVPQFGPVQPGDIRYKDQNGDQVIDAFDYKPLGKPSVPEWIFGFKAGFSAGRFDVEGFFQGAAGRSVYLSGVNVWAFQNNAGVTPIALGRWTPETASEATYPRLSATSNEHNYRLSDFWLRDGSFLRLRTLQIGFALPPPVIHKIRLESASVYISGVNVFTWDKVKVADPETLAGYPAMRSFHIGFRVGL